MSKPLYPYTMSKRTLSVLIGSDLYQTDRTNPNWVRIVSELNKDVPDAKALIRLMDPMTAVKSALDELKVEKTGRITVRNGKVFFENESLHNALADRILDVVNEGLPVESWIAFAENLFANPLPAAKDDLFAFLERCNLPFTNDGCFIAYKIVDSNYKDLHSRTFDNSIGKIVTMKRSDVDGDRTRTCSQGLHFCSKDYLPQYGTQSGNRVVLVKINPADVVSIPVDYNRSKGRTWRYQVVGEITREDALVKDWSKVVGDFDAAADNDWDDLDDYPDPDEEWCDEFDRQITGLEIELDKLIVQRTSNLIDSPLANQRGVEFHNRTERLKENLQKQTCEALGTTEFTARIGTPYQAVSDHLLKVIKSLLTEIFGIPVEPEPEPSRKQKKAAKKAAKTPSLKTLEKERKSLGSWEAVAKKHNTTVGAVRGWLKKLRSA